jgi:sugar-specific transcriptional regulator TrmB
VKELLRELGFSEYKSRTYIALAQLKTASAPAIAKKARVPPSKVYELLDALEEDGYVNRILKSPAQYSLNNPKEALKKAIAKKEFEVKRLQDMYRNLELPQSASAGSFTIVYGRDAFFERVKLAVQQSKKSIVGIVKNWRLDYELKTLIEEFVERGGEIRLMGPASPKPLIKEWHSIGTMTKAYDPPETRFTVWDNRIVVIAKKDAYDYYSLWIENEMLASILVEHFEKAWDDN